MSELHSFDVAIIGSGPGGYSTALRAAEIGKSVLLVEKSDVPGGVCLHEGCVPSKALLTAAHIIRDSQRAEEMGLTLTLEKLDIGKLIDYKENVVNTMTTGLEGLLRKRKVTTVTGVGSLKDAHTVVVTATDGSDETQEFQASNVVIATGSHPRPLPGTEFSQKAILSSQAALDLHRIPQSVIIVGSGPIGLEFATLWSSAGAKVTLLEAADRLLPAAARRVSATVTRNLKQTGIEYATGIHIDSLVEGTNQIATVTYTDAGEQKTVSAEVALVAIGRLPNTTAPWFSELGIDLDDRGLVKTDPYGRASVEGVWALGDITPGKQLAHRAFAQGIVVAEAIAGIDTEPVDDHNVPAVTFAQTEVGFVGYTAEEAKETPEFSEVKETTFPMLGNARVVMSGESGSVTVVSGITADRPDTPVVLGVQMAGPGVSELTAEAQQLVGNRIPLHEAARLVHPHPTLSETLGEALLSADGRPLHASR